MKKILEYMIKPRFSLLFIVFWVLVSGFWDVAISLSRELYGSKPVKTQIERHTHYYAQHEGRSK